MIRAANLRDIPEMLDQLEDLHALHDRPLALDRSHCAAALAQAMRSADWLVLVVDLGGVAGLLVASAGATHISPSPVAIEHAWIVRVPGWGQRLIDAYEAWAVQRGCRAAHLSTAPGDDRLEAKLVRGGYRQAERAWVKVL